MARRRRKTKDLFKALDTTGKRLVAAVLTAGALATAIGAIMALAPDPGPDPEAKVAKVRVGLMTLDEYVLRRQSRASLAQPRFVTYVAQDDSGVSGATSGADDGDGDSDSATDAQDTPQQGQTQTGEDPAQTTTDGPPSSTTTTETDDPTGDTSRPLGAALRERLAQGVSQALEDPALTDVQVPDLCVEHPDHPACGEALKLMLLVRPADPRGAESDNSPEQIEQRLVQVFTHTRTAPIDPSTGKRPLLGVEVNFDVALSGLEDETVDLHWSLHHVGGDLGTVPRAWYDEHVLYLEPASDDEVRPQHFWVPLPQRKGPFFLRLAVVRDGEEYASEESPEFR
jgi:hypothetical protein